MRRRGCAGIRSMPRDGRLRSTPAGVIGRLQELRDELALDGIVAELNPGGLIPAELEMRSFELIANEVAPALR